MLLLWVVISAGLLAVALVLNTSSHNASCIQSMGTVCPSPSIPQHADASHVMNPPPLAEAFSHRQPASCAIVPLDRQAQMIDNTGRSATGS